MADPAVTDILVNRFDEVFVERFGVLQQTEIRFQDDDHLIRSSAARFESWSKIDT